jgi:hypothetical protein
MSTVDQNRDLFAASAGISSSSIVDQSQVIFFDGSCNVLAIYAKQESIVSKLKVSKVLLLFVWMVSIRELQRLLS